MWDFSLENGMETASWCAELAFRTRASMSAIGSVIVIGLLRPLSPWFHADRGWSCRRDLRCRWSGSQQWWYAGRLAASRSPGALGHAGELAAVGHLAKADAAQAELAVDRVRSAAALTPRISADLELRRLRGLVDQCGLGPDQFSLNGKPSARNRARPSSSLVAVVTTVMSMPRTRSMRSWSISWNTACSLRPNVKLPRPSNCFGES